MDKTDFNHLNLSWWNAGVSPGGRPRKQAHQEHLRFTIQQIIRVLTQKQVDFLALGEVSEADTQAISLALADTIFEIKVCNEKVGRGTFCHAYIFNSYKIKVVERDIIQFAMVERNYRVGQSLIVEEISGFRFLIVLSHWPSKLQSENEIVRSHLATTLKSYINDFKGSEEEVPYAILMGDYNMEPFEEPLSVCLMATRDKTKVRKKQDLLYNPFWKKMGMSQCDRFCGSYYYRNGLFSYWALFDQIIFSSSFINGNRWNLIEESVDVGLDAIYDLVTNNTTHFDHLPVFARLEKTNE